MVSGVKVSLRQTEELCISSHKIGRFKYGILSKNSNENKAVSSQKTTNNKVYKGKYQTDRQASYNGN